LILFGFGKRRVCKRIEQLQKRSARNARTRKPEPASRGAKLSEVPPPVANAPVVGMTNCGASLLVRAMSWNRLSDNQPISSQTLRQALPSDKERLGAGDRTQLTNWLDRGCSHQEHQNNDTDYPG
jgi:hypothetical protein